MSSQTASEYVKRSIKAYSQNAPRVVVEEIADLLPSLDNSPNVSYIISVFKNPDTSYRLYIYHPNDLGRVAQKAPSLNRRLETIDDVILFLTEDEAFPILNHDFMSVKHAKHFRTTDNRGYKIVQLLNNPRFPVVYLLSEPISVATSLDDENTGY